MNERPTKMIDGIKIIGVIEPATDGCSVLLRGEHTYCVHYDDRSPICTCPFQDQPNQKGLWLTEDQALPLLLTGDVK